MIDGARTVAIRGPGVTSPFTHNMVVVTSPVCALERERERERALLGLGFRI